jgi:hypothetical protein
MHDFDGACKQFREAFLDSIDFITQSGTPRWWSAAQLIAAAVDALGGAHLPPNGETSGATFQAFVKKRFPPDYKPYAAHLYKILRCGLLHVCNTVPRSLYPAQSVISISSQLRAAAEESTPSQTGPGGLC